MSPCRAILTSPTCKHAPAARVRSDGFCVSPSPLEFHYSPLTHCGFRLVVGTEPRCLQTSSTPKSTSTRCTSTGGSAWALVDRRKSLCLSPPGSVLSFGSICVSRHVVLPQEVARMLPKGKLLSEQEWRSMGVQQSRGWVHYAIHRPEPHIMLFRRPLSHGA